jgi:predicted porin
MSLEKQVLLLAFVASISTTVSMAQQRPTTISAFEGKGENTGAAITASNTGAQAAVSSVISCAATGSGTNHCAADTSAGVVLLHPTGDTACLLGRNWGYDANSVWVTEGCAGDFATGSTTRVATANLATSGTAVANSFTPAEAKAITTGVNPEIVQDNKYLGFFNPYGSLRTIIGITDGLAQIQDDASRVGIKFNTRGPIKVFAQAEWGVDLVQSETQFNVSAQTDQGFGLLNKVTNPVFTARLGLVGVDLNKWGKLSFGKQNSVHYDITDYTTDRFNVFGGQASATYVAGTDGGVTGTGRADQVAQYHNTFLKILDFGAQAQFRGADVSTTVDGFGFSLQAQVLPGLRVGGAYTKTYFSNFLRTSIAGFRGGTDYWAFGAKGNWRFIEYGAVFARQRNGDLTYVADTEGFNTIPVVFDANGVELYSRIHFGQFAAVGGFIDYSPQNLSPLINPNFRVRYAVLGGEWHISRAGYAFFETRLGDSVDANGKGIGNAGAIGFRYDFSWNTPHLQ